MNGNSQTGSADEDIQFVAEFYRNLPAEVELGDYNANELELINHHRLYYGRYLNPRLRNYFEQTVIPNIARGLGFLNPSPRRPLRILDLGCGLGMQSLIFAATGAEVVGVDIRESAVQLCNKRRDYYLKKVPTRLNAKFLPGDFNKLTTDQLGAPFDGVFSMAAFSYIQPLGQTVAKIAALTGPKARIFLFEENSGHILRRLKGDRRTPRPEQVASEFARHGFTTELLQGAGALPGAFWQHDWSAGAVKKSNNFLNRFMPLSFSYILGLARHP